MKNKQHDIDIIISQINYCYYLHSIYTGKREKLAFEKRRTEKPENADWLNELPRPDVLFECWELASLFKNATAMT